VNLIPLIGGARSRNKCVPDVLFHLDDACVGAFLRGVFEGDGHVRRGRLPTKDAPGVWLTTASGGLGRDVQLLLQRLGIASRLRDGSDEGPKSPRFRVAVHSLGSLARFEQVVGFISERKRDLLRAGLASYTRRTRPRLGRCTVVSVSPGAGVDRSYDLTVPGVERFVANGLVVHNSGTTYLAKALMSSQAVR
jgi:intein/homing endonuclease